jgi:hypothetical protein
MSKGRVEFTVNGRPYDASANCVLDLGKPRKEPILNGKGEVVDYKVTYAAPSIKVSIIKSLNLHITQDILSAADATIVATDGDGKKYLLEGATHIGAGEYNFEDGMVSAEFSGSSATEI